MKKPEYIVRTMFRGRGHYIQHGYSWVTAGEVPEQFKGIWYGAFAISYVLPSCRIFMGRSFYKVS